MNKEEMLVARLKDGTVIDHVPANKIFEVINLLNIQQMDTPVLIGYNLHSHKMGTKAILKVENKFFTDEEISRLAVVAQNVVLNIIRNYEVVEKKEVCTPDDLKGIVLCNNPKCITNNEPMETLFHVVDKEEGTIVCHYCEKEQHINDVKLK